MEFRPWQKLLRPSVSFRRRFIGCPAFREPSSTPAPLVPDETLEKFVLEENGDQERYSLDN